MKNKQDFAVFGDFLYYDLKYTLKAFNQKQSKKIFNFVEKYKDKFYFLAFFRYEFYKYLEDKHYKSTLPYCLFFAYKKRKTFKALKIDEEKYMPSFVKKLDKEKYYKNFNKVKEIIAKGQSYQVNLTQELKIFSHLDSFDLFNLLLDKQNTKYKAYIKNDLLELLCFSPELFFKIHKRKITTKPMKGTIQRGKNEQEDTKNKLFLKNDMKNLSENVMIVDLLRNDLSKLIKKHSMQSKLFDIETHPTLHQMTSLIEGKLKKNINIYKIFKALFPCGSITGAPKIETIKVIKKLEKRQRGIYCGSIGLIHKNKSIFNVSIRTLEKENNYFKYGVGSGLVWDSNKEEEFKELELKTKFLNACDFYLFETMLYKNGKILFLKEHLKRLLNSAQILNFNTQKLEQDFQTILNQSSNLQDFKKLKLLELNNKIFNQDHFLFYPFVINNYHQNEGILKLILYKEGHYKLNITELKHAFNDKLILSKEKISSKNDALFFKSSLRKLYDDKSSLWKKDKCYDIAFFNEKNELCEASRSNIIIKKEQIFYTPALESGLLDGIYRRFLLNLKIIKEKKLFKKDLLEADAIYCMNSVRGLKKVVIL
ncbi:chorismate-binding protein [Campylobacter sp. TTU_617]|uniref:chorismate-binding protein n=1 Tax=Campylobacter sp. TTU_617 TaxID=2768148 RepID=UPI001903765E|nr:bifunctional anthranilate synthase component I family protein/class IV aminotransferase [Campylobacter sp. TTU_617]MBK1971078.1 bifunctional anthranilate synthase component I family protein/aminotransferase class IV [Campylobacter sp. TTU_617]